MSFTSVVKNEASKLQIEDIYKIAELSAIISNSIITDNLIKIYSENASVARRIHTLLKDVCNITPKIIVRKGYNYHKNYIYLFEITKDIDTILDEVGLDTKNIVPKNYILDDDESIRAYIRGVFILIGSINDPKTSRYHLEFLFDDFEYANFFRELLNTYQLSSKYIKRENKHMIYIKEAEKIGDFLRIINTINALFYYEDIRIYRDHKNMTNRLNNCEQANVDKIIMTADNQIKDIELIISVGGLDLLEDKVKEVAVYREKYPETSLSELSEIISIETGKRITKSGLNHRFNKIKEFADKIRSKDIPNK